MSKKTTRRRYLKTAAATAGAVATMSTAATAQTTTFRLDLTEEGWIGRAPESIAGTTNPTLNVEAGNNYAIEWTNRDDVPDDNPGHNLVIKYSDEASQQTIRSDFLTEVGATQTVEFTASAGLQSYFCEMHLGERGDFAVSGVTTPTATPTESTPTEEMTPTEETTPTTTATNTPGFGALAAVAGIGGLALRSLRGDD